MRPYFANCLHNAAGKSTAPMQTTWCSSSNNHNNIDNPQNICEGVIRNVLNSK